MLLVDVIDVFGSTKGVVGLVTGVNVFDAGGCFLGKGTGCNLHINDAWGSHLDDFQEFVDLLTC